MASVLATYCILLVAAGYRRTDPNHWQVDKDSLPLGGTTCITQRISNLFDPQEQYTFTFGDILEGIYGKANIGVRQLIHPFEARFEHYSVKWKGRGPDYKGTLLKWTIRRNDSYLTWNGAFAYDLVSTLS